MKFCVKLGKTFLGNDIQANVQSPQWFEKKMIISTKCQGDGHCYFFYFKSCAFRIFVSRSDKNRTKKATVVARQLVVYSL